MSDIITLIRQILELGFPAVVLAEIYVLWRRNQELEAKLIEWVDRCLEDKAP